jgi:Domain of unknown function (DUF4440)
VYHDGALQKEIIMIKKTIAVACMAVMPALSFANDTDALIALDKQWGEAKGAEDIKTLVSDKLVSVDSKGVSGKADLLKTMATEPAPEGPYIADNYSVSFTAPDTAIMVHSAGSGEDSHWSMHVWKKTAGTWQVAATSSIPAEK